MKRLAVERERAVNSSGRRGQTAPREVHVGERPAYDRCTWTPTTQAAARSRCSAQCSAAVPCWRGGSASASSSAPRCAEEPAAVPPGVAAVLVGAAQQRAGRRRATTSVLKATAPAYAMGLVRGDELVDDELLELVRQVRRDGQIRETELLMPRDRPAASARHRAGGAARAPGWCWCWSRTAPASAGSRRSGATSSPT